MVSRWSALCTVVAVVFIGGCAGTHDDEPPAVPTVPAQAPSGAADAPSSATQPPVDARPDWLGTRALPERPDGLGETQDTPPELIDRRFPPPDARPVADGFSASISPIPDDVLARSSTASPSTSPTVF